MRQLSKFSPEERVPLFNIHFVQLILSAATLIGTLSLTSGCSEIYRLGGKDHGSNGSQSKFKSNQELAPTGEVAPTEEPAVPPQADDSLEMMTRTLVFQGRTDGASDCPSALNIFSAVDTDPSYLEVYVNTLKRDLSECLWDSVTATKAAVDAKGTIGLIFGFSEELSAVLGYTTGTEFVVSLEPGTSNLLFGVFGYRGYDFGLGLPGAGFVQGFVYGDCGSSPLDRYTGWFRTVSGVANNYSYGKDGWWSWEDTNCNAWSITRGTTTPVAGVSRTYYMQEGRFLRVKGDYFAPTVAYLKGQSPAATP